MKTKKIVSIVVLVLILLFASVSFNTAVKNFTLSDKNASYLGGIKFHRAAAGLEEGFQIAKQEDKPIMMYFWAIWCQYCARFQTNTLGNPEVKKILEEDYVLVSMDLDEDKEVTRQYGVSYPPYLIFMDKEGKILERVPGAVEADYLLPIVQKIKFDARGK